jgi:uncharacterized protein (TIGR03000 family)
MYSVVLMMALSGGSEAVDFGHRCKGCTGYACSGATVCTGYAAACTGRTHRCHGTYACSGSACHGTYACSGSACTGSCHGGLFSRLKSRCHGCTGTYACTGSACTGGTPVVPMTPETPKTPPKVVPKSVSVAPATIIVSIPAGATLTVDGTPTTSTSAQRVLVTPALDMGSTYVYTLVARINGQVQTQDIQVRAGETTQVNFAQTVASR